MQFSLVCIQVLKNKFDDLKIIYNKTDSNTALLQCVYLIFMSRVNLISKTMIRLWFFASAQAFVSIQGHVAKRFTAQLTRMPVSPYYA